LHQLPYFSPADFRRDELHSAQSNFHCVFEEPIVGPCESYAVNFGSTRLINDEDRD